MNTTTSTKNIRNVEAWVGKSVTHMANWMQYQYPTSLNTNASNDYFVCEATKRLTRICNEAYYGDYFETKEQAEAAGYDECYYYSEAGLYQIAQRYTSKAA